MPKTKKKTSKRKPNPAFMRPVQPDDKLSAVVGSAPLPRSELTKKLWNYIKKRGLQDKKKRTMINADDSLRPVFNGKSQVSMFEMTKMFCPRLISKIMPTRIWCSWSSTSRGLVVLGRRRKPLNCKSKTWSSHANIMCMDSPRSSSSMAMGKNFGGSRGTCRARTLSPNWENCTKIERFRVSRKRETSL